MRSFGFLWRATLVATVFFAGGVLIDRAMTAHAIAQGRPEIEIRMAAAMAGLFGGGATACLLGIVLFLARPRDPER